MPAERFKLIMRGLFVIYSKANKTDEEKASNAELIKIYWALLKDYDIAAVENACKKYVTSDERCEFFPKPGQIIKLIVGSEKSENTYDAHEKWAELIENIKRGHHEILDDAVYTAVRQIGGSRAIGMIHEDKLDWKKREFIERYLDILDRNKRNSMINVQNIEISDLRHIGITN